MSKQLNEEKQRAALAGAENLINPPLVWKAKYFQYYWLPVAGRHASLGTPKNENKQIRL